MPLLPEPKVLSGLPANQSLTLNLQMPPWTSCLLALLSRSRKRWGHGSRSRHWYNLPLVLIKGACCQATDSPNQFVTTYNASRINVPKHFTFLAVLLQQAYKRIDLLLQCNNAKEINKFLFLSRRLDAVANISLALCLGRQWADRLRPRLRPPLMALQSAAQTPVGRLQGCWSRRLQRVYCDRHVKVG